MTVPFPHRFARKRPKSIEVVQPMARTIFPSSFECDCGHQIHFIESTIRGMEVESRRSKKSQRIIDSEDERHFVEFLKGRAVAVICPELDRRKIHGYA
jgi:hypothetical protein